MISFSQAYEQNLVRIGELFKYGNKHVLFLGTTAKNDLYNETIFMFLWPDGKILEMPKDSLADEHWFEYGEKLESSSKERE